MGKKAGLLMKYFVLKPAGDDEYAKASRFAMRAYARMIRRTNSRLSGELSDWADSESPLLEDSKEQNSG